MMIKTKHIPLEIFCHIVSFIGPISLPEQCNCDRIFPEKDSVPDKRAEQNALKLAIFSYCVPGGAMWIADRFKASALSLCAAAGIDDSRFLELVDAYTAHLSPQWGDDRYLILLRSCPISSNGFIEWLVDKGADVHEALRTACSIPCVDAISYVIPKCETLDLRVKMHDISILGQACVLGNVDVASLLLRHGANINDVFQYDHTAFSYTLSRREFSIDIVRLLLLYGADVNANPSLMREAIQNGSEEASILLLNSYRLPTDDELLERAINCGHVKLFGNLLARAPGYTSTKCLHTAARSTDPQFMAACLDHGMDINATDRGKKQTALHTAAAERNGPVIKLLVDRGANVNALDKYMRNPMHLLMDDSKYPISGLTTLLKNGVDVNAKDSFGTMPIDSLTNSSRRREYTLKVEKCRWKSQTPYSRPTAATSNTASWTWKK